MLAADAEVMHDVRGNVEERAKLPRERERGSEKPDQKKRIVDVRKIV